MGITVTKVEESKTYFNVFSMEKEVVDDIFQDLNIFNQTGQYGGIKPQTPANDPMYVAPDMKTYIFSYGPNNAMGSMEYYAIYPNNMATAIRNKNLLPERNTELTNAIYSFNSYKDVLTDNEKINIANKSPSGGFIPNDKVCLLRGVYIVNYYRISSLVNPRLARKEAVDYDPIINYYRSGNLCIDMSPSEHMNNTATSKVLELLGNGSQVDSTNNYIRVITFVPEYEIVEKGAVYVPYANLVITHASVYNDYVHPLSNAGRANEAHEDVASGIAIYINDTESPADKKYYMKIGAKTYKVLHTRKPGSPNGAKLFFKANNNVTVASGLVPLEEMAEKLGIYDSYYEADKDISAKAEIRLKEIEIRENELQVQYQKVVHDNEMLTNKIEKEREKAKLELDKAKLEIDKLTLEKDKLALEKEVLEKRKELSNIEHGNRVQAYKLDREKRLLEYNIWIEKTKVETTINTYKYIVDIHTLNARLASEKNKIRMEELKLESDGIKLQADAMKMVGDAVKMEHELETLGVKSTTSRYNDTLSTIGKTMDLATKTLGVVSSVI